MAKQVVHECIQTNRFNVMSKQVAEVKADIDGHRAAQQESDAERMTYREKREQHDLVISNELETIKLALFGNEKLGIAGDHQMLKEIHSLLVQGSTIKKFLAWLFGSIMGIIFAVLYIFHLFKDIDKH
jgi:beta-xylosidase